MSSRAVLDMDSMLASLRALPEQMQGQTMRSVVGAGASVVKAEVVQQAPEYTGPVSEGHPPPGTLKKSIYMAYLRRESSATRTTFVVSVRSGKHMRNHGSGRSKVGPTRGKNYDAFYWKWVEFGHYTRGPSGTSSRKAGKTGEWWKGARFVLPRSFLRKGFEMKKAAALQAMRDRWRLRLPEAIERARQAGGGKVRR